MRSGSHRRRQGPLTWLVLASFLLQPVLSVTSAYAAVRFEDANDAGRARAVAPADGEHLNAGEARFAVELPGDVSAAWVVAAAQPFDAASWTSLPEGAAFKRADAASGLVAFDALALEVTRPTEVWWTVATVSRTTGRLRTSAVRSFTVLPRFTNRVAPSPYLLESRRGVLGATDKSQANVLARAAPRIRLSSGFNFAPTVEGAPQVALEGSSAALLATDTDQFVCLLVVSESMSATLRVTS